MTHVIRNIFSKHLISKRISFLLAVLLSLLLVSVAFSWEGNWSSTSVSDYKDEYGSLKITTNGMLLTANSRLFIRYFDLPSEAHNGNKYSLIMSFVRSEKAFSGLIFKGEKSGLEFSISSKGFYKLVYFETGPNSLEYILQQGEFRISPNKTTARLEYEPLSSNLKAYIDDGLIFDAALNSLKKGVNPPIRIIKVGLSAINDKRGDKGEVLVESLSVIAN